MSEIAEVCQYIQTVTAGKRFDDEELLAWSETFSLKVGRDQWEPCVKSWLFVTPTPRGDNQLRDLRQRLIDCARTPAHGNQPAAPESERNELREWRQRHNLPPEVSNAEVVSHVIRHSVARSLVMYGHLYPELRDELYEDAQRHGLFPPARMEALLEWLMQQQSEPPERPTADQAKYLRWLSVRRKAKERGQVPEIPGIGKIGAGGAKKTEGAMA